MSFPQNMGNASSRPNDTLAPIAVADHGCPGIHDPAPVTDEAFEAAITEASEHPERAAELVEDLGIGNSPRRPSALLLVLQGAVVPPFDGGVAEWYAEVPPQAFDAGLGRVLAEEAAGERPQALHGAVAESYLYARAIATLVTAIQDKAPAEDLEELLQDAAAWTFRAGWIMACEHADMKAQAQQGGAR